MRIANKTQNTIIAEYAQLADTPISRMVGLLNRESINPQQALIITQTRSIHMFFMKFSIDVIFTDKKNHVVGLVKNIKPFQMSPYYWKASSAIELPVGVIEESGTKLGDEISIEGTLYTDHRTQ